MNWCAFKLAWIAECGQHPLASWCGRSRDSRMNCNHCQTELPANYSGGNCPNCGKELSRENSPESKVAPPPRRRWFIFLWVLFAPSFCSFAFLALDLEVLAALAGVLGSLVSGVVCTRIVMSSLAEYGRGGVLLSFAIGLPLCCLCFFLSGVGCVAAVNITGHGI
jgi:hypothetical protein